MPGGKAYTPLCSLPAFCAVALEEHGNQKRKFFMRFALYWISFCQLAGLREKLIGPSGNSVKL